MKLTNLKSNKAFTLQDAAIAIIIIMLFAGTIGATMVNIYKVQAGTKIDAVASLFIVQITERIDKLGYTEVTTENMNNVITQMRKDFSIPQSFNLNIEIEPDEITKNLVKTVNVQFEYNFLNEDRSISVKTLKVKEFEGETNER